MKSRGILLKSVNKDKPLQLIQRREINEVTSEKRNKNQRWKKSKPLRKYFEVQSNQAKFMDNLYKILELHTLDDFVSVNKSQIIDNGGQSLLNFHYSGEINNLLSSVYPNYPWNFNIDKSEEKYHLIPFQRRFF